MTASRRWASNWKTTQLPTREAHQDAFRAEFEDPSGRCVRVRIAAQELREFGVGPSELEKKAQHTEQVLRAILEAYVSKYGIPAHEIDAQELGSDLALLKHKFGKD